MQRTKSRQCRQNYAQRKKVTIFFELVLTAIDKIFYFGRETKLCIFYFSRILGHEALDNL